MLKTSNCLRFEGGGLATEKNEEKKQPSQRAIIPDSLHTRQMKCELQYSKEKGYNHMSG